MKNLINNLNYFFEFKKIDEDNVFVFSNFYLKDTGESYPINIKKLNEEYLIHDGGRMIIFLNENDIKIDKEKIQRIMVENPNFIITQNNELICATNIESINIDIAKYIQIITKISE